MSRQQCPDSVALTGRHCPHHDQLAGEPSMAALLLLLAGVAAAAKPLDVYWNSSNPLFSAGEQHTITVNQNTHPWEYDQVRIYTTIFSYS